MRILTLLVRHGTDKFPGAVDDVAALFARQLPEVEWDLIVIDNKLPEHYEEVLAPHRLLIGGSNSMREFSAWESGLGFVGQRLADYDFVNLATEAFRTLYTPYLDRFGTDILRLISCRGVAVGHVDYYNEPVLLLGRQSQAWLRTSFVFLPPRELKMLGSLISVAEPVGLFSGDPEAPFRPDAPLSENYRNYLLGWLTGEGTGQGVEWHSRFTLSHDTLPLFQNKVIAILNEHMFSVRLRAQGCAMVDTTWLATRAGTLACDRQPLGPIPSWRKQLTERDTDPVSSDVFADRIASLTAERDYWTQQHAAMGSSSEQTIRVLSARLEEGATERENLTRELDDLRKSYAETTSKLSDERQRLTEGLATLRERHEQIMQELQRRNAVLDQIQNSRAWKALSLYYRLRNKLIPQRMTRIVKEGVSLLRDMRLVSASGLFDKDWYLRRNPDVAQAGVSPLRHYLRRGALEGRDPNMLFDSDWYLTQYPDVAKAGVNPLVHYLRHGANEGRDPNPDFDSDWYLKQYPDVAKAGVNPLRHFLLRGGIEQRDPSPLFNTRKYLQMHPEVALAKLNPFAHFFRSGKSNLPVPTDDSIGPPAGDPKLVEVGPSGNLWAALNSSVSPPEQEDSSYDSMVSLLHSSYRSRIENLVLPRPEAFSVGDHEYTQCAASLEFRHAAVPLVSIVIPVCNQLSYTLECLTSISRHSDGIDYEVVVIDDSSSDATPDILSRIANLVYVRNNQNLGFIRSCNRGAERSRGKYILFFANDAQATRGWLRPLIETFDRHANVGAVGPKILYPSGKLQEAGACVNHDGTSTLVGLLDNPSLPQYNRLREVPYCSRVCLVLERKIFLDIGGFDEDLTPAYCEDCDLGFRLRRLGLRVIYNPEAVVLHHLSVTSGPLFKKTSVVRNQQKLAERWQREIDELNEVKLIAFYLPQFHPIPENDRWWGKGFTEWTNVAKARPNYFGHYQPHIPADIGFYDLRLDAVREQQGLLARRYGIYGFCYYYYWFAGKRLLEEPLERMLETNKPDLPFCLMWANENWTRRWDGHEKHVLIAQQHSDEDDLAVMQDLMRYLKHRNYIRVNGRPLLIVYRVSLFPSILRTTEIWRELCHREGIGDIYLAMAESFEYTRSSVNPASLGFDASVEFPPHGMSAPIPPPGAVINPKFNGVIHDYRQAVAAELRLPKPAHVRFRSAIPTWDNTARRQDDPLMFEYTSPGAYQAWLEAIMESTRQYNFGDERLVFINAWNEWAEGNHLEPDKRNGHAFLEATLKAKQAWLWRHTNQW